MKSLLLPLQGQSTRGVVTLFGKNSHPPSCSICPVSSFLEIEVDASWDNAFRGLGFVGKVWATGSFWFCRGTRNGNCPRCMQNKTNVCFCIGITMRVSLFLQDSSKRRPVSSSGFGDSQESRNRYDCTSPIHLRCQ